jgi:hypothetical protein
MNGSPHEQKAEEREEGNRAGGAHVPDSGVDDGQNHERETREEHDNLRDSSPGLAHFLARLSIFH